MQTSRLVVNNKQVHTSRTVTKQVHPSRVNTVTKHAIPELQRKWS